MKTEVFYNERNNSIRMFETRDNGMVLFYEGEHSFWFIAPISIAWMVKNKGLIYLGLL